MSNKLKIADYLNKKYGKLLVIGEGKPYIKSNGAVQTTFLCQCDCGNIKTIHSYSVSHGFSVSCGCVNKQNWLINNPNTKFVGKYE